jgi:hypothetical protein
MGVTLSSSERAVAAATALSLPSEAYKPPSPLAYQILEDYRTENATRAFAT